MTSVNDRALAEATMPELMEAITREANALDSRHGAAIMLFGAEAGRALVSGFSFEGALRDTSPVRALKIGAPHVKGGVQILEAPESERNRTVSVFRRRVRPLSAAAHRILQSYRAAGTGDEARLLLFDGRRALGFVAVHRPLDLPRYSEAELDAFDAAAPRWRRLLLRSLAREQDFDGHAPVLLFDASAKLGHASRSAAQWLTSDRRRELERIARGVADGAIPEGDHFVDPTVTARVSFVTGAGSAHLVCTLSPTAPALISPLLDLTPRQREVAAYAAAGATVPEVAEDLGISVNTIRQHLKVIYKVLDIGTRAELARLVAEEECLAHPRLRQLG